MFDRYLTPFLESTLANCPAVALLSARQVGNPTMAAKFAELPGSTPD